MIVLENAIESERDYKVPGSDSECGGHEGGKVYVHSSKRLEG